MNTLMLLGIAFFLWFDYYIPKREKLIFLGCLLCAIILNIKDGIQAVLERPEYLHHIGLRTLMSCTGYIVRPLLLWGLWEELRGKKNRFIRSLFIGLVIVNTAVFCTQPLFHLAFYYKPDTYQWVRGPLGFTAHIVMVLMMILFIPILFEMFISSKKQDFCIGLLSLLVILISTLLDTYADFNSLSSAITMECILYFLFLHIELEREYTKALLVAQKAEMMLMQIKPHFINNTLSTIQALCEIDPPLAAHTTGNFARYLRTNLTAMDKPLPIPIKDEIEHTKTYLEIEMLRFPWIEAEYDLQDMNFSVPALTIQPLVENAIQHGLRKRKKGKVLIATRRTEKGHMVQITDNGSGFDEKNPVTKEGHGVGIRNVKFRIESISHGTLQVESTQGEGTTITIYIP